MSFDPDWLLVALVVLVLLRLVFARAWRHWDDRRAVLRLRRRFAKERDAARHRHDHDGPERPRIRQRREPSLAIPTTRSGV